MQNGPVPGMSDPYDIILPGVYFCDLVFTGLPGMPSLGKEIFGSGFDMLPGGTFNVALALHRLGLRTGWAADFGSDFFSQFVLREARREGLDESLFRLYDSPLRSVTASLSFPEERAFISYVDSHETRLPLEEVLQYKPRCLLLPWLACDDHAIRLMQLARQQGTFIYMDCQSNEETLQDPCVVEAIRSVDVFAPNESEAQRLTGQATVEEALAYLSGLAPLVLVKLGKEGVIARQGEQVIMAPAIPVEVVDTTGAGDCFNAGFLYGHLNGKPLEACLQYGNICGGLSTTRRGCLAAPTASQVEEKVGGNR
jgi:sugar/nucleoside kinase (ribokinase family)